MENQISHRTIGELVNCEGRACNKPTIRDRRVGNLNTEGVDVESEERIEALNKLSIAIATTDVRDCFHRFRMSLSLSKFFCLQAVPAQVLSMTAEMLMGQKWEAQSAIWPC